MQLRFFSSGRVLSIAYEVDRKVLPEECENSRVHKEPNHQVSEIEGGKTVLPAERMDTFQKAIAHYRICFTTFSACRFQSP
jgi:hypothetical protein